jgi:hypothetical protein
MEEMPYLSAHSSEVSTISSPPTMLTYDNPGSRGITTVGNDPGYLAQVEDQVEDQALFVKAVLAWDTSILSQLHTSEVLDAALFRWDGICMGSSDPMWSSVPFRDNVPPGSGVVCGVWVQIVSRPSALVLEQVTNDYGPYG